jgi:hypothetical protein
LLNIIIIITTSIVAGIAITTIITITITWQSRALKPDDLSLNNDEMRTRAGAWVRGGVELKSCRPPKPISADVCSTKQKHSKKQIGLLAPAISP